MVDVIVVTPAAHWRNAVLKVAVIVTPQQKHLHIHVREGVKKKRFFLGLCPKLWVGGGQKS